MAGVIVKKNEAYYLVDDEDQTEQYDKLGFWLAYELEGRFPSEIKKDANGNNINRLIDKESCNLVGYFD